MCICNFTFINWRCILVADFTISKEKNLSAIFNIHGIKNLITIEYRFKKPASEMYIASIISALSGFQVSSDAFLGNNFVTAAS